MPQNATQTTVLRAISFAARAHTGQLRKDGKTPYIAHPMRVMTVLSTVFGVQDPKLLATAVLHDTIEDTTTDFDDLLEAFGPEVAHNVALLTKDPRLEWTERETAYQKTLMNAPVGVKLCKMADTLDNLVDSAGLPASSVEMTVRKARAMADAFREQLSQDWSHVLAAIDQQIERAAAES